MNKTVLDASAIFAILFEERGAEKLTDEILQGAVISTVNLAEVQTKLVRMGHDPEKAWVDALLLESAPEPYTSDHAKVAGALAKETRNLGLSLGIDHAWRWRLRLRLRYIRLNRLGRT
jgi:ribonuclease VapC